jgi:hypothetical protein
LDKEVKIKSTAFKSLVGKLEWKRSVRRRRRILEDNNKIAVRRTGCGDLDWVRLAQYREQKRVLVNKVMNLWDPLKSGNFLSN